jgi:hypothetical protein
LPRNSLWLRPGTVHVHLLEEIATDGCAYDDRERLAGQVYARMAEAQRVTYGVESPPYRSVGREPDARPAVPAPGVA